MWYVTLLLIHFCTLSSGRNAYQARADGLPSCQGWLCWDASHRQAARLWLLWGWWRGGGQWISHRHLTPDQQVEHSVCCRSMQVQNPSLECPVHGFILTTALHPLAAGPLPKLIHAFNMHWFIRIQEKTTNQFMCLSLLAALSSCLTPPRPCWLKHSLDTFDRGHGGGGHLSSAFVGRSLENIEIQNPCMHFKKASCLIKILLWNYIHGLW